MNIQLSDHFSYGRLFKFVLPSIIMMVFTSIYGVIDGLFVSNFAGKTDFAAINLIMPFPMILGGMGFMIGAGGSALVGKTLGEGDKDRACKYFSMMILFTVLLGLVLTLTGVVFIRPIAYFLGATENMVEACVTYGKIVICFTTAFMLQNVFQSFLITAEKPQLGLLITVAAGVTNMILDAVFVAGFEMGVAGAALATGISQCVGGILPLAFFLRSKSCTIRLVRTGLELKPLLNACANGSSELMNNISMSIVSVVYNLQLMKFIGEDGVSAYGVIMYVQFFFIAIFIGYSIGCAPVVSYNYGAKNESELKNLLGKSMKIMTVMGLAITVVAVVLAPVLAGIFVGYDRNLYDLTVKAFNLFAFSFLLAGINIFMSGLFTALNNGLVSAVISFLRTLVFQMISVLVLPVILGTDGIWWAITVAEVFACIISVFFLLKNRRKYNYF